VFTLDCIIAYTIYRREIIQNAHTCGAYMGEMLINTQLLGLLILTNIMLID